MTTRLPDHIPCLPVSVLTFSSLKPTPTSQDVQLHFPSDFSTVLLSLLFGPSFLHLTPWTIKIFPDLVSPFSFGTCYTGGSNPSFTHHHSPRESSRPRLWASSLCSPTAPWVHVELLLMVSWPAIPQCNEGREWLSVGRGSPPYENTWSLKRGISYLQWVSLWFGWWNWVFQDAVSQNRVKNAWSKGTRVPVMRSLIICVSLSRWEQLKKVQTYK